MVALGSIYKPTTCANRTKLGLKEVGQAAAGHLIHQRQSNQAGIESLRTRSTPRVMSTRQSNQAGIESEGGD